jgi:hypothetical protein
MPAGRAGSRATVRMSRTVTPNIAGTRSDNIGFCSGRRLKVLRPKSNRRRAQKHRQQRAPPLLVCRHGRRREQGDVADRRTPVTRWWEAARFEWLIARPGAGSVSPQPAFDESSRIIRCSSRTNFCSVHSSSTRRSGLSNRSSRDGVSRAANSSLSRRARARLWSHFETILHLFLICAEYPERYTANKMVETGHAPAARPIGTRTGEGKPRLPSRVPRIWRGFSRHATERSRVGHPRKRGVPVRLNLGLPD